LPIFHDRDLETLLDIVRDAGRLEIMPRFRALDLSQIAEKKNSIDLVTEADFSAEKHISDALRSLYPDALILGEEAYESDQGLMDGLRDAALAFVIDPVDGTFNFQAGLPVFGTNLAVIVNGETVAGIIHEPVLGDTLTACKGAGSHLVSANGTQRAIQVAKAPDLSEMVGTISINDISHGERARIAANLAKTRMAFAYNCSAYEYWLAATGKVHFMGHYKLMPWDHLAGVLIHQEAGGHTAKFDGSPYSPGDISGGILSAPNMDSWEMILRDVVMAGQ
jgi:fructose-1,6-bisphosphatase/inositol monophosphatase family enzyme